MKIDLSNLGNEDYLDSIFEERENRKPLGWGNTDKWKNHDKYSKAKRNRQKEKQEMERIQKREME